jgi:hypothetical protein
MTKDRKKLFVDDILKVIYAPGKVFKDIIANPKYLGVLVVLILFISIQAGFQYTQFSKTYSEGTSPIVGQFYTYTNASSGNWQSSSSVTLSNNENDYFNYSVYVPGYGVIPRIFGNSSLQISSENTANLSAALGNVFNVNCGPTGFQNFTIIFKQTQPQIVPQTVKLSLYSLSDADFYQYDLTPSFSNASTLAQWNNLTIPIGPNAGGWTATGTPNWSNITALKFDFMFSAASNSTINIGGLFFRGHYVSYTQFDSTAVIFNILQSSTLQFVVYWGFISLLIYAMLRVMKSGILWKPIFIAVGFALVVMVIRSVVNLIATVTLPEVYYPFDLAIGLGYTPYGAIAYSPQAIGIAFAESQLAFYHIETITAVFRSITFATLVVSYVWLGALCAIILKVLKPEFSLVKRIAISVLPLGVTILVLLFFITGTA